MKLACCALALVFVGAAFGCPGGSDPGGDGGLAPGGLQGTWAGTIEDPSAALGRIKVVFAGDGAMTVTTSEGTLSGTASRLQDNLYEFRLDDGTSGGFMLDADGKHAGFVDENFFFGVVQKNATGLPVYAGSDIAGSWSGSSVELSGSGLDLMRTYESSATVTGMSFAGNDAHGVFAGSFQDYDADYGRFRGGVSRPDHSVAGVAIFLSADKSFAAGYACLSGGHFPDDCNFSLWRR
jgi:hypothetical protein